MGQKVNPIAVRMKVNRISDSSWFSDYYYSTLLYQDFNFRQYISLIKQPNGFKLGFRPAKTIIYHFPKKTQINLFCLSDLRTSSSWGDSSLNESRKVHVVSSCSPKAKVKATIGANLICSQSQKDHLRMGTTTEVQMGEAKKKSYFFFRWYNSSILSKKRALVNLHRGNDENWTPLFFDNLKMKDFLPLPESDFFFQKRLREAESVKQKRLLSFLSAKQRFAKRLAPCPWEFPPLNQNHGGQGANAELELQKRAEQRRRHSFVIENLRNNKRFRENNKNFDFEKIKMVVELNRFAAETRVLKFQLNAQIVKNFFNFYALHYYFIKKTNNFYDKQNFAHLKCFAPLDFTTFGPLVYNCKQTLEARKTKVCLQRQSFAPFNAVVPFWEPKRQKSGKMKTSLPFAFMFRTLQLKSSRQLPSKDKDLQANQQPPTANCQEQTGKVRSTSTYGTELRFLGNLRTPKKPEKEIWSSLRALASISSRFCEVQLGQITRTQDFYLYNMQSILSQKTSTLILIRPFKVSSVFQCASLVAQEIACKLEQKKSFRLTCRLIFQQLLECKYIKGIRITCSGRLNGAEIAKTECRKSGETSLHVFSDKIDYAQTNASTPYGTLGVKVWVSYI